MKNIVIFLFSKYKYYLFSKYSILGENVKIGFTAKIYNKIKSSVQIGSNCYIQANLICSKNGSILIGNYCSIRHKTLIESENLVSIGNYVIISNNVIISDNNSHPTSYLKRREMLESGEYGELWDWSNSKSQKIIIEDDVWIGRNVFILKGVTIGKGSIVASASVVTKDIPPYSLCYGNPCKIKVGKYENQD